MRQQLAAQRCDDALRRLQRWRHYATSAPCLQISLAELVKSTSPQFFGVDVRSDAELAAGRMVACVQHVASSSIADRSKCAAHVRQLAAMRGAHVALLGAAGVEAAADDPVASFARALVDAGIPNVSSVVGGYRNAHDAYMQGKRQLLKDHHHATCKECLHPPPSAIHWRVASSTSASTSAVTATTAATSMSASPASAAADHSDVELIAGAASQGLKSLQASTSAVAAATKRKAAVVGSTLREKASLLSRRLAALTDDDDDAARRERASAVTEEVLSPSLIVEEPDADDSWMNW